MLKYTKVKIELFKDVTMFDYVDSSIMGGLCIASQNIADNDDGKSTISSCENCQLVIINSFLNLIKIDMDKIKTIHVC